MAIVLRLPRFSEDHNPAIIVRWLKKEGERVEKGDVLVEIETDKSLMEIEAEDSGVLLYIKVPLGEVYGDDILGVIGEENENVSVLLKGEEMPNSTPIDKTRGVDIIRLPKLSDMMESAKVVNWKVKEGDGIKKGDIIAEVETDKAIIEVESFREGTVLYRSKEATTNVKENEILIIVGEKGAYIQNILEENGLK
jgi:pyruvate dehydrogenase E2 component (dihydrolipoamide acetyltransferase)